MLTVTIPLVWISQDFVLKTAAALGLPAIYLLLAIYYARSIYTAVFKSPNPQSIYLGTAACVFFSIYLIIFPIFNQINSTREVVIQIANNISMMNENWVTMNETHMHYHELVASSPSSESVSEFENQITTLLANSHTITVQHQRDTFSIIRTVAGNLYILCGITILSFTIFIVSTCAATERLKNTSQIPPEG